MKRSVPLALFFCLLIACSAEGPDDLLTSLKPRGFVNDFAGVFASNEVAILEGYLCEVREKTTAEIAVVALPSLEGGEISDFANRLFEKWAIGKKGKDNGLLLVAAIEDRKVRIEVGYGLEGAIPDGRAGRILDEHVIPFFKEGNYAAGLTAGATALAGLVANEAGVSITNAAPSAQREPPQEIRFGFWMSLFILAVIIFLIYASRKGIISSGGRGGYSGGGGSSGGGFGGFGGGRSGGGGASRGW